MHKIFLVHGMGNWAPGWAEAVRTTLTRCYDPARCRFVERWPFAETFELVEINYNDIFEEYLAEARQQASNLSKWSKLVRPIDTGVFRFLNRVVSVAGTAPSDKFLATHLGDVAFFMATDLGELVKNRVARQIAEQLQPPFNPARDSWSLIAHSLGTRVVTEVLQAGFTATPSLRSFGKAKVVMMIANVSRLLEGLSPFKAGDVYHNAVFPSRNPAMGACRFYINATHRLDPFGFIQEFDPPADFGDGRTRLDEVYLPVKLDASDITARDLHAFEHYLQHPGVHLTLFRYLVPGSGRRAATAQEWQAAMNAYREQTLTVQLTGAWRDSMAALKDKPFQNIDQIVELWEQFGELIS